MFYKAFDKDLSCKDFQYEVGKTYKLSPTEELKMCRTGFHACPILEDCFDYYPMNSRICQVDYSH